MRENIIKAKFIGKNILRRIVAMSLAISIGCFGANFCVNTKVSGGFSTKQTIVSAQSTQEDYISQDISYDSFSCLFNFFCCVPVVFFTIFRVIADVAQRFAPTSSKDK